MATIYAKRAKASKERRCHIGAAANQLALLRLERNLLIGDRKQAEDSYLKEDQVSTKSKKVTEFQAIVNERTSGLAKVQAKINKISKKVTEEYGITKADLKQKVLLIEARKLTSL